MKLNGFAISPSIPSIKTCEVVVGDASGESLYTAHFSDINQTVFSKKPQWTVTIEVLTQETSYQDSSDNTVPLSQEDPHNLLSWKLQIGGQRAIRNLSKSLQIFE